MKPGGQIVRINGNNELFKQGLKGFPHGRKQKRHPLAGLAICVALEVDRWHCYPDRATCVGDFRTGIDDRWSGGQPYCSWSDHRDPVDHFWLSSHAARHFLNGENGGKIDMRISMVLNTMVYAID